MADQEGPVVSPQLDATNYNLGFSPPLRRNEVQYGFTSAPGENDRRHLGNVLKNVVGPDNAKELMDRSSFDPLVTAAVAQEIVRRTHSQFVVDSSRKKYFTKYVSDSADLDELQKNFPQFFIVSDTCVPALGHPYARETRMLEHKEIFEINLGYNDGDTVPPGFDVLVKDIGGNPAVHDMQGRSLVHSCCPFLSGKDALRYDAWKEHVARHGKDAKVSEGATKVSQTVVQKYPVTLDYLSPVPKLTCTRLGQHCRVKSPVVTMIHSVYDMSLEQIGDCFDMANCCKAYVTFLFDPRMFIQREGELGPHDCHWVRYGYGDSQNINYSFRAGACDSYTHRFSNIVSLVTSTYFVTPTGRVFVAERTLRNYTMSIHYVYCPNRLPCGEVSRVRMPFFDDKEAVFVATWWFNTQMVDNKVIPVVIETTQKFLHRVSNYAATLNDNKFNIDNVKKFAVSCNSDIVVGQVSSGGPKHSIEEIIQLVVAIYMNTYDNNYYASQIVKRCVEDTAKVRRINSSSYFVRMLYKMFSLNYSNVDKFGRNDHPLIKRNGEYVINSTLDQSNQIAHIDKFDKLVEEYRDQSSGFLGINKILDKFEELFPAVKKKYPIYFVRERFFTLTQAVEFGMVKNTPVSYTHARPVSPNMYLESAPALLYSNFTNAMKSDPYIRDVIAVVQSSTGKAYDAFRKPHVCRGSGFVSVEVPGDGNCFYHCLIKALELSVSPNAVRNRLSKSKYVDVLCSTVISDSLTIDLEARNELINRLSPVQVPSDRSRWANDTVIALAALEYSVAICVHKRSTQYEYNGHMHSRQGNECSGTIIHLKYNDNHFALYVENVTGVSATLIDVDLEIAGADEPQNLEVSEDLMDVITVKNKVTNETELPKSIYRSVYCYTNDYNPYNKLDKYGYSSFYGPMLYTALKDKKFGENSRVLDVDSRNLSSLQVLCDNEFDEKFLNVTSLQLTSASEEIQTCRSYEKRLLWISSNNFESRMRMVARPFLPNEFYDLITINPAYYSDKIGRICPKRHFDHLKRTILTISRLKKDGSLVLAMPFPIDQYVGSVIMYLRSKFQSFSMTVPSVQPAYLTWWFLKCENFVGPECVIDDLEYHEIPTLPASINGLLTSAHDSHSIKLKEEIDKIVNKKYTIPSKSWVQKMLSLMPSRDDILEAGYDESLLPEFSDEVAPAKLPVFGKDWVVKNYGEYAHAFDKVRRTELIEKFSIEFRNSVYELIGDPGQYLRDVAVSRIQGDKFLQQYAAVLVQNKSPILKLKVHDVNKPVRSEHFYDRSILSKGFISRIKESLFPTDEYYTEQVGRPMNADMFDVSNVIPSIVHIPLEKVGESSSFDSSEPDDPQVVVNAGSGDKSEKIYWAENRYSTDVNRNLELAMVEYSDCISVHVEKVKANCTDTVRVLMSYRDYFSGNKHDVRKNLAPFVAQYNMDEFAFRYDGRYIFGNDGVLGRYVFAFASGPNRELMTEMVKVDEKRVLPKNFIYTSDLKVLMELDHMESFPTIRHEPVVDVTMVQAGPGCGKTHDILEQLVQSVSTGSSVFAIMKNKENVESAKSRLRSMINSKAIDQRKSAQIMKRISSIDVVLKDPGKYTQEFGVIDKVLVDEVITQPAGKIGYLAKSLNAKLTVCYGDVAQISWACRLNDFEPKYSEVSRALPISGFLRDSFRCPGDICYFISRYYYDIAKTLGIPCVDSHSVLRTKSKTRGVTIKLQHIGSVDNIPFDDKLQLLSFTQADKETLIQKFGRKKGLPIHTVHEYQGNENPRVALVRLSVHKNTDFPGDDGAFGSDSHIVSAISRHTQSSVYYTVNITDKLSKVINDINLNYPSWSMKRSDSVIEGNENRASTSHSIEKFSGIMDMYKSIPMY
nr:methyltransferase-helicase [Tea plant necrotic ring blotch virus]